MENDIERERLEEVADWYSNSEGKHAYFIDINYRAIEPFLSGSTCLELGSADGQMTSHLLEKFESVVCVDGSSRYCEVVKERFSQAKNLEVQCSLFEEYESPTKFDTILATDILEHLDEPISVLKRALDWIAPDGHLIALSPNAKSIHRLVGTKLGLLAQPNSLNERDMRLGHRRVYDSNSLRHDIESAGWEVEHVGGSMVKPVSDAQMEDWSFELIDAMFDVGREYLPEFASTIYVVARP
jgi:2-polyprenyl-3-methyl-5-hydroxy-6-metoxy-1,4-benzoquinol methylase